MSDARYARLDDGSGAEPAVSLSPTGEARRAAMLGALAGEVRRAGRRRRVRRGATGGAAACAFLLVVLSPAMIVLSNRPGSVMSIAHESTPSPESDWILRTPPARMQVVHTDPAALERAMVYTRIDLDALSVSDAELVQDLRAAGRPTGLMRIDGRTRLTAPVTDAQLFPKAAPGGY